MYRVIHLNFYRTQTEEYVFANLEDAKNRFNEICDKHEYDCVVLEDDDGNILDNN